MRQLMGDDFCKNKAVEIAAKSKNEYIGLLTILASRIRTAGSTVEDSREEFLGHADLDHGFERPAQDEPLGSPEELDRRDEQIKALIAASRLHVDLSKTELGWSGEPLKMD
jgi:hypothetical protein